MERNTFTLNQTSGLLTNMKETGIIQKSMGSKFFLTYDLYIVISEYDQKHNKLWQLWSWFRKAGT